MNRKCTSQAKTRKGWERGLHVSERSTQRRTWLFDWSVLLVFCYPHNHATSQKEARGATPIHPAEADEAATERR